MSGVIPPSLHYMIPCIGTTLYFEVNTKALVHTLLEMTKYSVTQRQW